MADWVADNGPTVAVIVSVLSLLVAVGGLARSGRALKLAHPAFLEAQVAGSPKHDEVGRPTLKLRVENTGPGIATKVRVVIAETFVDENGRRQPKPKPVNVADRLGVGSPVEVEIPASGDRLDLVEVQWRDGGGRHSTHPKPPPEFIHVWQG